MYLYADAIFFIKFDLMFEKLGNRGINLDFYTFLSLTKNSDDYIQIKK
jgi:hypothetical protein